MKKLFSIIILALAMLSVSNKPFAQRACSGPEFRQFDFWIGEWEVYGINGTIAGKSKISLLLDSCVILEEWVSANAVQGLRYAGKSFNKYNPASKQWQQTWVDNAGGSIEFLKGKYTDKKMVFETGPFQFSKDTLAIRRLSFYNVDSTKVRQFGEISKDNGTTWSTEYDLEYRRKNKVAVNNK